MTLDYVKSDNLADRGKKSFGFKDKCFVNPCDVKKMCARLSS